MHPRGELAWLHWAMRTACARGALGAACRDDPGAAGCFLRPATIVAWSSASPGLAARLLRRRRTAVETVELALDHYGPPVYVRKQIVHNIHVVRDLEARGAIFVDSEEEAPAGATIVYSAHGVAPSANAASAELGHNVIDATRRS